MQVLEVGQVWNANRAVHRRPVLLHVLAIFSDKLGKQKVVIQDEIPVEKGIRPVFYQARVVTPSYFYGLTVKLPCDVKQYSDQMVCACGVSWDVNDKYPPEGH